jgi:hypothetical protein
MIVSFHTTGCLFHGCLKCITQRNLTLPKTKESADVLYAKTLNKARYLREQGYKIITMWEHEYDANPPPISEPVVDRLNARDSFFGGRTNATRLHYKIEPGEKIGYADFTSLYPSVNKQCAYPIGHPKIIVRDFKSLDQYFGIAKVMFLLHDIHILLYYRI